MYGVARIQVKIVRCGCGTGIITRSGIDVIGRA